MSNETIESVEKRITEAKQELAKLEHQLKTYQAEPRERQLARELHDLSCNQNHTDGCGWYYEISKGIDDWSRSEHREWLKRAQCLIKCCEMMHTDTVTATALYKVIRGY